MEDILDLIKYGVNFKGDKSKNNRLSRDNKCMNDCIYTPKVYLLAFPIKLI